MAVTPLPFLDRTAATFKTDVDAFFAQKLPQFSVEVNQVATDAQSSATAANSSKNAAATSATNAATSATNAGNSATAANTSKTNAATSETNAAASATAANTSKNAAAGSATAAATSATNSEASAVRAKAAADSIASGPVTSVNGKTGAPVLTKSDIGLSLVDNVSMQSRGLGTGDAPNINNLDDLTIPNGTYSVPDTASGTRPPGQTWGVMVVSGRIFRSGQARTTQTFYQVVLGLPTRIWVRTGFVDAWTSWIETTRPAAAGKARKPLTPSDDTLTEVWSDILSIPMYLDRSITSAAAASHALDVSSYSIFDLGLTVNTTFSIIGLPTLVGETITIVVRIRQNSSPKTITWPSNITWLTSGGVVPSTPSANQIVEYVLSTTGSPANWYGRVGASS